MLQGYIRYKRHGKIHTAPGSVLKSVSLQGQARVPFCTAPLPTTRRIHFSLSIYPLQSHCLPSNPQPKSTLLSSLRSLCDVPNFYLFIYLFIGHLRFKTENLESILPFSRPYRRGPGFIQTELDSITGGTYDTSRVRASQGFAFRGCYRRCIEKGVFLSLRFPNIAISSSLPKIRTYMLLLSFLRDSV